MISWKERKWIIESIRLRAAQARDTNRSHLRRLLPTVLAGTKFLVDIAVPVSLVIFALRTDEIQNKLTTIWSLQNKAEIGFRIDLKHNDPRSTGFPTIVVVNNGAPIHGISVESFSYIDFNYTILNNAEDYYPSDRQNIPALVSTNQVETLGGVVSDVATISLPYQKESLRILEDKINDYPLEQPRGLRNYLRRFTTRAVIQIVVRNRDDTFTRAFYRISQGEWTGISSKAAAREYTQTEVWTRMSFDFATIEDVVKEDRFVEFYNQLSKRSECPFVKQIDYLPWPQHKPMDDPTSKLMYWASMSIVPMHDNSYNDCDLRKDPTNLRDKDFLMEPADD
jgi:hypothetical protein